MRTMKQGNNKSRKRTVCYVYKERSLVIDGVCIKSANGNHARNLAESDFVSIPNRNRPIERLLMITSSMLVDYHYNRRMEDVYDMHDCTYRKEMVDENPEESKAILLEAQEYCRIILNKVFQDDWMSLTGYIGWVIFLMDDICFYLKGFDVYLTLSEELESMVPHL